MNVLSVHADTIETGDEVSLDEGATFQVVERVGCFKHAGQNKVRIYLRGKGTTLDDKHFLLKRENNEV